jgi:hypothetical protein
MPIATIGDRRDTGFVVTSETHAAVVLLIGGRAYQVQEGGESGPPGLHHAGPGRRRACGRRSSTAGSHQMSTLASPTSRAPTAHCASTSSPCGGCRPSAGCPPSSAPARRWTTDLRHLARQLAALHAKAPSSPDIRAEGSRDAIRCRWTDSFNQVRPLRGAVLDDDLAGEIEKLTFDFLAGREALFRDRAGGVFGEPITRDQVAVIPWPALAGRRHWAGR